MVESRDKIKIFYVMLNARDSRLLSLHLWSGLDKQYDLSKRVEDVIKNYIKSCLLLLFREFFLEAS